MKGGGGGGAWIRPCIVLRQVIDPIATATTIKGKLCMHVTTGPCDSNFGTVRTKL